MAPSTAPADFVLEWLLDRRAAGLMLAQRFPDGYDGISQRPGDPQDRSSSHLWPQLAARESAVPHLQMRP
jgi:hypothetical protein